MDRRSVKTREQLIKALEKLIQTKDFDKLTIQQITNEADVNRATFYAHFYDKYDLLDATIASNLEMQLLKFDLHAEELNEQEVKKLFLAMTSLHLDYHTACTRGHETQYGVITKQLKMRIFKLLNAHMDETPAALFSAMLVEAYEDWKTSRNGSAEQYFEKIRPIFISGIGQYFK